MSDIREFPIGPEYALQSGSLTGEDRQGLLNERGVERDLQAPLRVDRRLTLPTDPMLLGLAVGNAILAAVYGIGERRDVGHECWPPSTSRTRS